MKMEIEFFTKGNYYIYEVEIRRSSKDTIRERLYLSGLGENEDTLIFEREGFTVKPTDYSTLSTDLLKKNNESYVGGIAGALGAKSSQNIVGSISRSISKAERVQGFFVGGLVGYADNGNFNNIYSCD